MCLCADILYVFICISNRCFSTPPCVWKIPLFTPALAGRWTSENDRVPAQRGRQVLTATIERSKVRLLSTEPRGTENSVFGPD